MLTLDKTELHRNHSSIYCWAVFCRRLVAWTNARKTKNGETVVAWYSIPSEAGIHTKMQWATGLIIWACSGLLQNSGGTRPERQSTLSLVQVINLNHRLRSNTETEVETPCWTARVCRRHWQLRVERWTSETFSQTYHVWSELGRPLFWYSPLGWLRGWWLVE